MREGRQPYIRKPRNAPRIHPTAMLGRGVSIGERTEVWDHVHIRGPSRIGPDCIIGEKTYIAYGVNIGRFVKINAHVYICTGVTIEDRVMIAAGVVFTNDRSPRAFMPGKPALAPSTPTAETMGSTVREGATVGAAAVIGPGIEIGYFAMVGMGSVVTGDVPPQALVYGNPARLQGYVCMCGEKVLSCAEPRDLTERAVSCSRCAKGYLLRQTPGGSAQLIPA